MRVRVYKLEDGSIDVLVEASVGKGRAPVLVKGVTSETVTGAILPVIKAMRRPRELTRPA